MAATVAPATSMMARVDRLDLLLGYLEEMTTAMHQQHRGISISAPTTTATSSSSPASASAASTPSWRRASSSCRSAKEALLEAQAKGSLIDRIAFLEDRLLRMEEDMHVVEMMVMITPSPPAIASSDDKQIKTSGSQLLMAPAAVSKYKDDEQVVAAHDRRRRYDDGDHHRSSSSNKKKINKKGLKSLVKSCVRGNLKTKE